MSFLSPSAVDQRNSFAFWSDFPIVFALADNGAFRTWGTRRQLYPALFTRASARQLRSLRERAPERRDKTKKNGKHEVIA
jgi:hypothetical protein